MNCTNCNQPLEEGAKFCAHCGTPIVQEEPAVEVKTENTAWQTPEQPAPTMTPDASYCEEPKETTNGLAIAGLVVSLVTPFSVIPLILSILGLVFGKKKWNSSGKGIAIAGIVISSVKLFLELLSVIVYIIIILLAVSAQPAFIL